MCIGDDADEEDAEDAAASKARRERIALGSHTSI